MILLDQVTKQFGHVVAVSQMTLKVSRGEVIGFLGPNGAGKTTTMRLILGYLSPTLGRVSIDDHQPSQQRIQVLKRTGYLPENNPLYTEMKVGEYLEFIVKIKGQKEYSKIAMDVGLEEVMSKKIEDLSRGYKQRVGLAAAMIGDPGILVLDEPTSGLDPIEQEKIRNLIKKIAKNKIIFFSTHILSEVEDVANRLVIINRGVVVYDGKKPREKGSVERLFKRLVK